MTDQLVFTAVGTVIVVGVMYLIRRWHLRHW